MHALIYTPSYNTDQRTAHQTKGKWHVLLYLCQCDKKEISVSVGWALSHSFNCASQWRASLYYQQRTTPYFLSSSRFPISETVDTLKKGKCGACFSFTFNLSHHINLSWLTPSCYHKLQISTPVLVNLIQNYFNTTYPTSNPQVLSFFFETLYNVLRLTFTASPTSTYQYTRWLPTLKENPLFPTVQPRVSPTPFSTYGADR